MRQIVIIVIVTFISFISGHTQTRGLRIQTKAVTGENIQLYNNSYALVIGVSNYTNGWPKLPNAVSDARDVAKELEQKNFNVSLVLNPSKVELEKKLNDFIFTYGSDPNDRLIIYFAGHGYTMKMSYGSKMGFIVPVDAPLPNVDNIGFRRKSISMEVFEHHARQIQSKHVLYLFDSCFSGSIFALSRAIPSAISYKTAKPVRQFITAGDEGEEVPDKSIFKSQFINGLRGEADTNNDGYITGTELGEFLQVSVVNYSRESQHPQYGKIRDPKLDKGDFVFLTSTKPKAVELSYSEWEVYNKNMRKVLTNIYNKSKNEEITASQELSEWENFLVAYSNDNPYSLIDNKMRDFAQNKKSELLQQVNIDDITWIGDKKNNEIQLKNLYNQKKLSYFYIFFDYNITNRYGIDNFFGCTVSFKIKPKWGLGLKYGFNNTDHLILAGPIIFFSKTFFLNVNAGIAINNDTTRIAAPDEYLNDLTSRRSGLVLSSSLIFNVFRNLYIYPSILVGSGGQAWGIGLGYGF